MKPFQFRLEPVLRLRLSRRDQVLQLMAGILADAAQWESREQQTRLDRDAQIEELKQISATGRLNIDRSAARRYHAGVLSVELQNIAHHRRMIEEQLNLCRQALAKVDQEVKLLEKMREKQSNEHEQKLLKRADREREEAWLGAHWMEFGQ